MNETIGIIGYGMVGKAVQVAFPKGVVGIVDPAYAADDLETVAAGASALFICVPTDEGDSFSILQETLRALQELSYRGMVLVRSTCLPWVLEPFSDLNLVYHPEFLTRSTAVSDTLEPRLTVFGGSEELVARALKLYQEQSEVRLLKIVKTDIKTAQLLKYTMNAFYATKVTFMNGMSGVASAEGADWATIVDACASHPWMGSNHMMVPGPDGEPGFGGPCLPKDTRALAEEYDLPLLHTVLWLNERYRNS